VLCFDREESDERADANAFILGDETHEKEAHKNQNGEKRLFALALINESNRRNQNEEIENQQTEGLTIIFRAKLGGLRTTSEKRSEKAAKKL